jgi:hypothetical protein
MDDHKLVMISIFEFSKREKDAFFYENMLGKFLVRMHENNFLKREVDLTCF